MAGNFRLLVGAGLVAGVTGLGMGAASGKAAPAGEARQRALEQMGYAALAPGNFEAFYSVLGLGRVGGGEEIEWDIVGEVLGGLLEGVAGELAGSEEVGEVLAEILGPELGRQLGRVLGEELFVGLGAGAAEQVALWTRLGEIMDVAQVEASLTRVVDEEDEGLSLEVLEGQREELLGVLEQMEVPPVLLGFRTDDAAGMFRGLERSFGGAALFRELLPGWEVESFAVEGGRFVSVRAGLEQLWPAVEGSEWWEAMGREDRLRLRGYLGALAGKRLELVLGVRGDYVLLAFGRDRAHLEVAGAGEGSLAGGEAMAVVRRQVARGREPLALGYRSAGLQAAASRPLVPAVIEGVRRSLAGHPAFAGMAARMDDRFREVSERDEVLWRGEFSDSAGLLFADGGRLRLEEVGGAAWPWEVEAEGALRFGGALGGDRVLAVAWREDKEKNGELLGHAASVAGLALDLVGEYLGMVDGGEEAAGVWDGLRAGVEGAIGVAGAGLAEVFVRGVGSERLFALDFGGTLPAVPGLPEGLGGELPLARFAVVHDVADRAAISEGSGKLGEAFEPLKEALGEAEVGLGQLVLKVQDGGLSSYFLGLPFWTADLMPSIAVGDEHYLWSSSRSLSRELVAQTGEPVEGRGAGGGAATELLRWSFSAAAMAEVVASAAAVLEDARGLPPELFLAVGQLEELAEALEKVPGAGGRIWEDGQGRIRRSAWVGRAGGR